MLYTDGVTEAVNSLGEEWTRERLVGLVRKKTARSAEDLVDAVYDAVLTFHGKSGLEDDLTLVVMRDVGEVS